MVFSNELRLRSIEEQLDGMRDDLRQFREEHHSDTATLHAKLDEMTAAVDAAAKTDTVKTVGGVSAISVFVSAVISGIVAGLVPKGGS